MKKYNDFVVSEGLIGDATRKLFKTVMGKVDKKIADKINNFTNKINSKKTLKESIPIIQSFSKEQLVTFQNMVNDVISGSKSGELSNEQKIIEIRKYIKDELYSVYVQLKTLADKFDNNQLLPNEIFKDQTILSKVFMFKDNINFEKNINFNTIEISKLIAKDANIDEKKLDVLNQKFEQETETLNDDETKAFGTSSNKFMTDTLYGTLLKQIEEINKKTPVTQDLNDILKNVKSTKNIESVKTIMNKIVDVEDKQTLIKIRDILGLDKSQAPL